MSYKIQLVDSSTQQIINFDPKVQQQIIAKLDELAINPLPEDAKILEEDNSLYLFQANRYRIVYQIKDKASLITVAKIAHPQDY